MQSFIEDDPEWPTFEEADHRISYSPDSERENIFKDFKPVTESKKKKNKKKSKSLRLVSESEVIGKRHKDRGRKKFIVIGVLVTCIVIIVAIAVFLAVYFGVIVKGGNAGSPSFAASNDNTTVTPPLTTTTQPVHHTSPSTRHPTTTIKSTTKPTTTTTTTKKPSTTTTTASKTTTTTTTTTTTPPPTEPPVRHYDVEADQQLVLNISEECSETTIRNTDGLNREEKCRLYKAMITCTYVRLIQQLIYVDIDTLGKIVENNTRRLFRTWIEVKPTQCRDPDGELTIGNISALPVDVKGLCASPDTVTYYWKYHCQLVTGTSDLEHETSDDVCKLYWGTVGCVSRHLGCSYSEVMDVVERHFIDLKQQLQPDLQFVNLTLCEGLYTDISASCELDVYLSLTEIYRKCTQILYQGSHISHSNPDIPCRLLKVFRNCAYRLIQGDSHSVVCSDIEHSSTTLEAVNLVVKVKQNPLPLVDTANCPATVLHRDVCRDSQIFVPVIDSICYKKLLYSSRDTQCKWVHEYANSCAASAVESLNLSCTSKEIRNAILKEANMIKSSYKIDVHVHEDCLSPST